jgi:simple sugar transport system permease protein
MIGADDPQGSSFDSSTILYYQDGQQGWTSPTWNGYNTGIYAEEEESSVNCGPNLTWTLGDGVLTIFGTGLANFLGKKYSSTIMHGNITSALGTHAIPGLKDIPVIGTAIFSQSLFVYFSIIMAVVILLYYKKTRFGLAARMVGESPATADASGIHVDLYKYVHILLSGAFCGLGGAYLSLVYVPYWQDNITAGIGWIAVALVIFSGWHPVKAVLGCYLFGVLKALPLKFQGVTLTVLGMKVTVASQIMDMIPYILTVVVLVVAAITSKNRSVGPASVGKSYFREDR